MLLLLQLLFLVWTPTTSTQHQPHGNSWPSVLGGLASIVYVALDPDAPFLLYGGMEQCVRQFMAVVSTLLFAGGSGYLTGMLMQTKSVHGTSTAGCAEYDDSIWWEGEYFEVAKAE